MFTNMLSEILKRKKPFVYNGMATSKDARGENNKTNYGIDTKGEKEKRTPEKNVDGRSRSSHDNKKFRNRSMGKQRGIVFGFRKTATAVKNTG
jgi:hypothetical protein